MQKRGLLRIVLLIVPVLLASFAFAASCSDTDGGINYAVKGTVTAKIPYIGFISGLTRTVRYTDSCSWIKDKGTVLTEYSCQGNKMVRQIIACPNCKDGVCPSAAPAPLPASIKLADGTVYYSAVSPSSGGALQLVFLREDGSNRLSRAISADGGSYKPFFSDWYSVVMQQFVSGKYVDVSNKIVNVPTPVPVPSNVTCQTRFKIATIYVYEKDTNLALSVDRLKKLVALDEKLANIAGRGYILVDIEEEINLIQLPEEQMDLNFVTILQKFYTTHGDEYDFLNIYINYPSLYTNVGGFHPFVRNKIKNIGLDIFDNDDIIYHINTKRLLGINYLGNLKVIFGQESLNEFTEDQLICTSAWVFPHEMAHQWVAYIGDQYGTESNLILQSSFGAHWFLGLSSDYDDPMGGGKWRNNGDGTFTLLEPDEYCAEKVPGNPLRYSIGKYSDLTLYLMGAIDKSQVKPILWINYSGLFIPGTTIKTESKYITIQDIINRYGERMCLSILQNETPSPITQTCTDSDKGKNYVVKGSTIVVYSNGTKQTNTDSCNKDGTLKEWYCQNSTALSANVKCPSGYYCTTGLCRRLPTGIAGRVIDGVKGWFG
jgi:hypothetical protein